MKPSQLTIGVTTHNRKSILTKCASTWANLNQEHEYILYDDYSTEFDKEFINTMFPTWNKFRGEKNSGGADIAMGIIMDLFLDGGNDYLLLLDSDLITDPALSNFITSYADETDGFFSIFNTTENHPVIGNSGRWVYKNHVGAAGTVWRRDLVEEVRSNVPSGAGYDWRWSEYLMHRNIRIMVSEQSYVQHLGFCDGQNSRFLNGDFGINYYGYTPKTISFMLEELINNERKFLKNLTC